jgi:hypothetical protein
MGETDRPGRTGRWVDGRYQYRISDRNIRLWTRVLLWSMLGGFALALIIGFASDGIDDPDAREAARTGAGILLTTSIAGPLLASAVLGWLSLHSWGWLAGALLPVGMAVAACGIGLREPLLLATGGIVLLTGFALFFVFGRIARAPMWFGSYGSRVYVGTSHWLPKDEQLDRWQQRERVARAEAAADARRERAERRRAKERRRRR